MSIDPVSLVMVAILVVLAGGILFGMRRLLRAGARRIQSPSRRMGFIGAVLMTSGGFLAGLSGSLLEELEGDNLIVGLLHTIMTVCWFPMPFTLRLFQVAGLSPGPLDIVLYVPALLLIATLWYLVFAAAAAAWARLRRP